MLPRVQESWLFVRPRAIYEHPQLGPILSRSVDDATERALIQRAERTGYDVRTLERVAIAWTPHGTVYFVAGPLDAARVADLLWDRLASPRARGNDERQNLRMEGTLGRSFVSLMVAPRCGLAAYADGDTVAVDRVFSGEPMRRDPESLLVWHARRVPDELAHLADAALSRQISALEVRISAVESGVSARLALRGPFSADITDRLRGALAAVVASPLGDLCGAVQWLTPERAQVRSVGDDVLVSTVIPWRALAALGEALRGSVGRDRWR